MDAKAPLLSVCVPTFSRAASLDKCLASLIPQAAALAPEVEVVVCDNASSDDTPLVLDRYCAGNPCVRTSRNDRNIGMAGNILKVTNEMARGEFAWLVGDDDVVLPGGIERVVRVLREQAVDYVFVNAACKMAVDRPRCEAANFDPTEIDISLTPGGVRNEYKSFCVDRWEELVSPDVDGVFLGAMMCAVFRLSVWRSYALHLDGSSHFTDLAQTYPHSLIFAHTMVGRPAYFLGDPCLVSFWGDQEWMPSMPLIMLVRLQALLDVYGQQGVGRSRVVDCRLDLIRRSKQYLRTMLFERGTIGRNEFRLSRFVWQNRNHMRLLLLYGRDLGYTNVVKCWLREVVGAV